MHAAGTAVPLSPFLILFAVVPLEFGLPPGTFLCFLFPQLEHFPRGVGAVGRDALVRAPTGTARRRRRGVASSSVVAAAAARAAGAAAAAAAAAAAPAPAPA